jgi:hypothetical protein
MSTTIARDLRHALGLALLATAATAAAALVVHAACPGWARALLGYRFPGVPAEVGEAGAIFAHNVRKLAGIYGLALVLQAPWLPGDRAAEDRPRWHPALATFCDCAVTGTLAGTVLAVVLGVGGYGMQMVRALLPHAPLEVGAFALAIVLYLAARRRPLAPCRAVTLVAASVTLLAIAALLETYLAL